MVPGADEVLPLNVQLSVAPPFVSVQVSDSVGPVTPKLAVATVGRVTESTVDADTPPYAPATVAAIVPPTARVWTVNVALDTPASTITLAGTETGSTPVSETAAPPAGAAPVSVAVAVTESPPTTVDCASVSDASATARGPTVNIGDWLLLLLIDAVNVAVPAATAVMVNDTLDEPTGMVAVVGTVATAGLLLDNATLAPPVSAAAVRVTVPWPTPPTMTLGALSVTPDTVDAAVVGAMAAPPH
jgi:hypothetical protein